MTQASVGFHCPECLPTGAQQVQRGPAVFDPVVTKALIAVNVVVSVAALMASGSLFGLSNAMLTDWSLFAPFVDVQGETYRMVTWGVLHDGLMHLAFNMWALWVLGSAIERVLGRACFLALYVTSLFGGAFGVLLLEPDVGAVGASGAVFGLFGAVAVVQRAQGINIWESGVGVVLGLNLLITFAIPQISIGGHLGGLTVGTVLTLVFVLLAGAKVSEWAAVGLAVVVSLALYGGSVWAAAQWPDPLF